MKIAQCVWGERTYCEKLTHTQGSQPTMNLYDFSTQILILWPILFVECLVSATSCYRYLWKISLLSQLWLPWSQPGYQEKRKSTFFCWAKQCYKEPEFQWNLTLLHTIKLCQISEDVNIGKVLLVYKTMPYYRVKSCALSRTTIVVHSRDHKGVGMAHEIIPPKNQPQKTMG